jgi:hypothetical protein
MGAECPGNGVSASVRVFARVLAGSKGRRLSAALHDLVGLLPLPPDCAVTTGRDPQVAPLHSARWPLLVIRGRKPFVAPSSTAAGVVLSAICRSLAMVTWDAPDFVVSARLVAAIFKVAGAGKFAGAVYMPVAEIIPSAPLPPSTPFTAPTTVVSVAFVTFAVNVCVFPRITVINKRKGAHACRNKLACCTRTLQVRRTVGDAM